MSYKLFNKEVKGRFGFPSGVIATNSDTAIWMLNQVREIGFYIGKSTTIEPKEGNPEDIFLLSDLNTGVNAVGYANLGLKEMIKSFHEIKEGSNQYTFLMPQIGESDEERFEYCVSEFDKTGVDGIELNVSCPHAKAGGILIGSDPKMVASIVKACRKATKKPLVVKLNAGVEDIKSIALAAIDAGANGLSAINTLGGFNPELYNEFGGLSGPTIFPITLDTVKRLRKVTKVPMIVMGGIQTNSDIKKLDEIDPNFFYAIGTSLAQLDSKEIQLFFTALESNIKVTLSKEIKPYKPFVVKEIIERGKDIRIIKFYQNLKSKPGQFVFLKVDNKHSKPFSVANDLYGLEILVRRTKDKEGKFGETTKKLFELKENSVVRIKGPYGKPFELHEKTIYVGAGCGIGAVHHASLYNTSEKIFVIGAKTGEELSYIEEMKKMGTVYTVTEDGTGGMAQGMLPNYLTRVILSLEDIDNINFFCCGPEKMLEKVDVIARSVTSPDKIFHLVERMTSCGEGICGKCSIPNGKRACVDGPVFTSTEFCPGMYVRDKTGKKITL